MLNALIVATVLGRAAFLDTQEGPAIGPHAGGDLEFYLDQLAPGSVTVYPSANQGCGPGESIVLEPDERKIGRSWAAGGLELAFFVKVQSTTSVTSLLVELLGAGASAVEIIPAE